MAKKINKNKKEIDFSVHQSIEARKKFKAKMLLRFLLLILVLCGCAAMGILGGWSWNPDEGLIPTENPKQPYQYALIWLAIILGLVAIVLYVIWTLNTFKKFYNTQLEYFKTKDFETKKAKALKQDPAKLNKATIKWYKKLGYLTSAQKTEWIYRMKDSKKKK